MYRAFLSAVLAALLASPAFALVPAQRGRPGGRPGPRPGPRPAPRPRPAVRPSIVPRAVRPAPRVSRPPVNVLRPQITARRPVGPVRPPVRGPVITRRPGVGVIGGIGRPRPVFPGRGIHPVFGPRHVSRFHNPWHRHYRGWSPRVWRTWSSWPSFWAGAVFGSAFSPSVPVYVNPYYVVPQVESPVVYDYSRPIVVPSTSQVEAADQGVVGEAMRHFDQARGEFLRGQYPSAQTQTERAISLVPSDPDLHQFRSLTLFAQGKYADAASAIHTVLAAGPGWDWSTVRGLYPDEATYTHQLRTLEDHIRDNRRSSASRFLLGYHYLVLDQRAAAQQQFEYAAGLEPTDSLARQLADSLAKEEPEGG